MNLLALLSSYFEHYLTFDRVNPTETYNYAARRLYCLPVVDVTMRQPKCQRGSWLYVATPENATLASLGAGEKLYVGSQTTDRMFRGDGLGGRNFHHAEMRAGNGEDNLISFLRSCGRVKLHRISAASIVRGISATSALYRLRPLLTQSRKHVGYWFEHFVLDAEKSEWRWNTAGADKAAVTVFRSLKAPACIHVTSPRSASPYAPDCVPKIVTNSAEPASPHQALVRLPSR